MSASIENLLVLPVAVPLVAAALLCLLPTQAWAARRMLALAAAICVLGYAALLLAQAHSGEIEVLRLGNWPSHLGIVLVNDRLSALMLLLTAALGVIGLLHGMAGDERRGRHFHALWMLQLAGLNGAFLTGDLFNLFVCFELLLAASYGLLLHGEGTLRVRRALHYVIINLAGSALFLVAAAVLYGNLGTLNMAELARRIGTLSADQRVLVDAGSAILLVVFLLKAAILPLYFWLPRTYGALTAVAAILFAVLTKLGIYAVIRIQPLLLGDAHAAGAWLWPLGLATLATATAGMLAANSVRQLCGFAVVASSGTLLALVGTSNTQSLSAALFYLPHSTLTAALLLVLAHCISESRGVAQDSLRRLTLGRSRWTLAWLFLAGAMLQSGFPPLSGFLSKMLMLQSLPPGIGWWVLVGAGLLGLIALIFAGVHLFWHVPKDAPEPTERLSGALLLAPRVLLVVLLAYTVGAGSINRYTDSTAAQLAAPEHYLHAVLAPQGSVKDIRSAEVWKETRP